MPKHWLLSSTVSVCLSFGAAHASAGLMGQPFTVTLKAGNQAAPNVFQNTFNFQNTSLYTQSSGTAPIIGPSANVGFHLGSDDQVHPAANGQLPFDVIDLNLMRVGASSNLPGFDPANRTAVFEFSPFLFGPQSDGSSSKIAGADMPFVRIDTVNGRHFTLLDPVHGLTNSSLAKFEAAVEPNIGPNALGTRFTLTLPDTIRSWDKVKTVDLAFATQLQSITSAERQEIPEPATLLIWSGLMGVAGLARRRQLRRLAESQLEA